MPSPIGHMLGGAVVYLAGTGERRDSKTLLFCALLGSIAPDLDFLPGILIGQPAAFHHGISHSFAFAMLFGALTFLAVRRLRSREAPRDAALMAGFAYAFHIVLDLVSVTEGKGVPIFWPISEERLGFDLFLFGHFHHDGLREGIWSVVRWENVPAVMREAVVMGVPLLSMLIWRRRRETRAVQWEA